MQAVAEKIERVDYGLHRQTLRSVLRHWPAPSGSAMADWHTTRVKGEQSLVSPNETYEVIEDGKLVDKRKPAFGQWSTTTHATATRRYQGSKAPIVDTERCSSRYVQAIFALSEPHPANLLGRYRDNPQADHLAGIVLPIMEHFSHGETRWRAANMANHILRKSGRDIWDVYEISEGDWNGHAFRKTWNKVRLLLREYDQEAIKAWVRECDSMGLDLLE